MPVMELVLFLVLALGAIGLGVYLEVLTKGQKR